MENKSLEQIIDYLKTYNQWRRGEEIPQPNPTELGVCIDDVTKLLENILLISKDLKVCLDIQQRMYDINKAILQFTSSGLENTLTITHLKNEYIDLNKKLITLKKDNEITKLLTLLNLN